MVLLAGVRRSATRQEAWQDSLTVFTTLVADAPDNARGHLALGELYSHFGAWDRGIEYLYRAQRIEPAHRFAYASVLARSGRCREALGVLDSVDAPYYREAVGITRSSCLLNERRLSEARRRSLEGLAGGYSRETFTRLLLLSDSLLAAYDSIDARNRWVGEGRPFDRSGRPFTVKVESVGRRPLRPIFNGGRSLVNP
jgi:hypothetical protein